MTARARFAKGVVRAPKFDSDLERDYHAVLEARKQRGEIRDFRLKPLKLRLADGTFYTPDFGVMAGDDVWECHETKGFMREAARVRLNVAAAQFPFRFFLVSKMKGEWVVKQVEP